MNDFGAAGITLMRYIFPQELSQYLGLGARQLSLATGKGSVLAFQLFPLNIAFFLQSFAYGELVLRRARRSSGFMV